MPSRSPLRLLISSDLCQRARWRLWANADGAAVMCWRGQPKNTHQNAPMSPLARRTAWSAASWAPAASATRHLRPSSTSANDNEGRPPVTGDSWHTRPTRGARQVGQDAQIPMGCYIQIRMVPKYLYISMGESSEISMCQTIK